MGRISGSLGHKHYCVLWGGVHAPAKVETPELVNLGVGGPGEGMIREGTQGLPSAMGRR